MNSMVMLLRREFWEHRSLWIAPLVWVGIIVVLWAWVLFFGLRGDDVGKFVDAPSVEQMQGLNDQQREDLREAIKTPAERKQTVPAIGYLSIWGMISFLAIIVVFFYLIDCLFTERRDRSILFWKSLPLSDTQVVLSKYAVALIVVPLGVILLAAVVQLLAFGLWTTRFHGTVIGELTPDWDFLSWLRAQVVILSVTLAGVLWYAPIAAYFLMLSAWARRMVFLWAVIPLFAIPALEGIFFQSQNFLTFLGQRFGGFIPAMSVAPDAFSTHSDDAELPRVQEVFNSMHLSGVLTSAEMWVGLVAAAAMIYTTIRIRRYRDES